MAANSSRPPDVSDVAVFIVFAYIVAFGAWTAIAGNDFINARWKSVQDTRRRGYIHLVLSVAPMVYMLAYIFFQGRSGDYKEMSAAVVALVFAAVHLLRTAFGLWQLHHFRKWLIISMKSLASLGCGPEPAPSEEDENYDSGELENVNGPDLPALKLPHSPRSYEERADRVCVNETIVDNRITEGDIAFHLRLLTKEQERNVRSAGGPVQRYFMRLWLSVLGFLKLIRSSFPLLRSVDPITSFIVPRNAEEVWVRWACVLTAYAFPKLPADIRKANVFGDIGKLETYSHRREIFARQVLLSAALHASDNRQRISDQSEPETESISNTQNLDGADSLSRNFLDFEKWKVYTTLQDGIFCKQEFLQIACESGKGLPFDARHSKAICVKAGEKTAGYSRYASRLGRAREALPADIGENIERFGIDELEWLAIFLSVGDWTVGGRDNLLCKLVNNEKRRPDESSKELDRAPRDVPYENLSDQLGFRDKYLDILQLKSFPLLQHAPERFLWGNRNVLEVSVHIDNALALSAGDHVTYMLRHAAEMRKEKKWMSSKMRSKFADSSIIDMEEDNTRHEVDKGGNDVWEENSIIAQKSMLYQFCKEETEHSYLEQSLSFLGASLESMRSSLARWENGNDKIKNSSWEPVIPFAESIEFEASRDFVSCIRSVNKVAQKLPRFVEMRLLWELQNELHSRLLGDGAPPSSLEVMILCILSFPALEIQIGPRNVGGDVEFFEGNGELRVSMNEHENKFERTEKLCIAIQAVCGPQNVTVRVVLETVEDGKTSVSIRLDGEEESEERFRWESWRDAFSGRLEGMRLWQREHKLPTLDVIRTKGQIGRGIAHVKTKLLVIGEIIKVWSGWLPPRAQVCQFEIESDNFVLHREKVQFRVPVSGLKDKYQEPGVKQEKRIPVAYSKASRKFLQHSSIVAHEVLRSVAAKGFVLNEYVHLPNTGVLQKADRMASQKSEASKHSALILYDILASCMKDVVALEKAVNLLVEGNHSHSNIQHAIEMVECFCTAFGAMKPKGRGYTRSLILQGQEEIARKIKELLMSIVEKAMYDETAVSSFARLYSSFSMFDDDNGPEVVKSVLCKSMLFASTKHQSQRATKLMLASVLPYESKDDFDLTYLLFSRNRDLFAHDARSDASSSAAEISLKRKICHLLLRGEWTLVNLQEAVRYLRNLIEENSDCYAMNMLGGILQHGATGVPARPADAAALYTQAINEGNDARAMYNLALLLRNGAKGVPADGPRAVFLYTRAITQGNLVSAMYNLGNLLRDGAEGVPADPLRAISLYNRAIEEGNHVGAMNNLANLLSEGADGVRADGVHAIRLYQKAIDDHNNSRAMNSAALILEHGRAGVAADRESAVELYKRAFENGETKYTPYNLAVFLQYNRMECMAQDMSIAELYSIAAEESGDAEALNALARLHEEGMHGATRDVRRAVNLYERAIEKGHVGAMFNLGVLLKEGRSDVKQDIQRACELYSKAAQLSENVRAERDDERDEITTADEDRNRRNIDSLYNKIGSDDDAAAMYKAAVLLEIGVPGVQRDAVRAAQLYARAVNEGGHVRAMRRLAAMLQRGVEGVAADSQTADALLRRATVFP